MKKNGADKTVTSTRRAKQPAQKSQLPPTFSHTHGEEPSGFIRTHSHPVDTEPNYNGVMDILVDISSRLLASEHFVEQIRARKATEET